LIMNHCTILDNSTQPDDTFAYGLEGGGLAISGVASLSDCTISRNHAHKRGGGLAAPGLGGNGRVDLKSCTITHNVADEEGGGLYCPGGMITVLTGEGTTIQHNTAKFGAGIYNEQGVIMLADCIIDSNDAEGTGGGILIRGGTITFVADGGSAVTNNTAGVSGGGILAQAAGAVTLNGTPVSGNTPDNCAAAQAITGCEG